MRNFFITLLLLTLPIIGTGCNPLAWLYDLYTESMAELAQNAAEVNEEEPPPPEDDPIPPTIYWDADTLDAVSSLPYDSSFDSYNSVFGKWRVQVVLQNINNNDYWTMIPKGKTIIIEPDADYVPGTPLPLLFGEYFEDYSTEYVSPDFYERWFEERLGGAYSLDAVKNNAGLPAGLALQDVSCEHSGITEGRWNFSIVPVVMPDGNTMDAIGINFNQTSDADLSSKCGYNFNGTQYLMPESSGWRSFPVGGQTWHTTFEITFPYGDDFGDFDTMIFRNEKFIIGLERVV